MSTPLIREATSQVLDSFWEYPNGIPNNIVKWLVVTAAVKVGKNLISDSGEIDEVVSAFVRLYGIGNKTAPILVYRRVI